MNHNPCSESRYPSFIWGGAGKDSLIRTNPIARRPDRVLALFRKAGAGPEQASQVSPPPPSLKYRSNALVWSLA